MAFLFWQCFVAVHTMLAVTILLRVRPSACLSIVISVSNVVESLFKIRFFVVWIERRLSEHFDLVSTPTLLIHHVLEIAFGRLFDWLHQKENPTFKRATTRKRQAQKFELKSMQPPLNVLVFMRYFSKPYLCGGFFWYVRLTI